MSPWVHRVATFRVTDTVHIVGDDDAVPITWQSTLAEALADPVIGKAIAGMLPAGPSEGGSAMGTDLVTIMGSMPLDRLKRFGMASDALDDLLATDRPGRG